MPYPSATLTSYTSIWCGSQCRFLHVAAFITFQNNASARSLITDTGPEGVPHHPALAFVASISEGVSWDWERWPCLDHARAPAVSPTLFGDTNAARHDSVDGGLEPIAEPTVYASLRT